MSFSCFVTDDFSQEAGAGVGKGVEERDAGEDADVVQHENDHAIPKRLLCNRIKINIKIFSIFLGYFYQYN